jgi:hypothetical protein
LREDGAEGDEIGVLLRDVDMLGKSAAGKEEAGDATLEVSGLLWGLREGIGPKRALRNMWSVSVFPPRSLSQLDPVDTHRLSGSFGGLSVISVMLA